MAKVTLSDIARELDVSVVTVHNALKDQKGVSEEMRTKIKEVARALGYGQQKTAEWRMKYSVQRKIGVLVSEKFLAEYDTYYWKIYKEIALQSQEMNCVTSVEVLMHHTIAQKKLPRIVEEGVVNAVIVLGELDRDYIAMLRKKAQIPVVFLDFYNKDIAEDCVVANNFIGMYTLTEHLRQRGFTRMAYVGSIDKTSSIMDRYLGFYKSVLENGLYFCPQWLIPDRDDLGNIHFDLPDELPEAFVCNCDLVATLLIQKLQQQGYRVPEDISVVGFDNYPHPGVPDLGITTYEVNMREMARAALKKVISYCANENGRKGMTIIAGHIVEKKSIK